MLVVFGDCHPFGVSLFLCATVGDAALAVELGQIDATIVHGFPSLASRAADASALAADIALQKDIP